LKNTKENGSELVSIQLPSYIPHNSQIIDDEHGTLRGQIEELKIGLEYAQMLRRRKIEYDLVAEKINTLPSREELEQCVAPT
jgi:Tho complex subunit 7